MPIVQQGSINTTALSVPDLYVQIVQPQVANLNGVPSNNVAVVGSASFGPVNQPVVLGSYAQFVNNFGPLVNRKYDAGTHVAVAQMQGSNVFTVVRVTDGTDTAASVAVLTNCITFTGLYTGSGGAKITVQIAAGSKANTWKAIVSKSDSGLAPEVFDNIAGTGNALWLAMASAVNSGVPGIRGKSQLVSAAAGAGTTAPSAASYPLTGGADGASGVTATTLLGADASRSGMYALRNQNCSVLDLADCDTQSAWTTADAFALSEGLYNVVTGPAGETIASAVSSKATAGVDSYATKILFGDWLYFNDPVSKVTRLVSPQAVAVGRLGNLSPEQSPLNKPLYGIVGSQRIGAPGSGIANNFSSAELQTLFNAGIDVVTTPAPGGNYWTVRAGHNSSSSADVQGDNYTRMVNYTAVTLDAGMGVYIGRPINAKLFGAIKGTLVAFLTNMLTQGMLALNSDGSLPFSVICDVGNNPDIRTGLGYVQADVKVRIMGINEKFLVNLEAGSTVSVARLAA